LPCVRLRGTSENRAPSCDTENSSEANPEDGSDVAASSVCDHVLAEDSEEEQEGGQDEEKDEADNEEEDEKELDVQEVATNAPKGNAEEQETDKVLDGFWYGWAPCYSDLIGLQNRLDLRKRQLRIGTLCSGTDAPIKALEEVIGAGNIAHHYS